MKIAILIILIICGIPVLAITAYLVWLNRASETIWSKIFTVVGIGLVGVLITTWYSLKSENIELEFRSALFFHKSDKTVLEKHHANWLQFGGAQFDSTTQHLIDTCFEQKLTKEEFEKDHGSISEFYHDLVFIKLFSHFSKIYYHDWEIRVDPLPMENPGAFTFEPIDLASVGDKLKWADISEVLDDNNNLRNLLSKFSKDCWSQEMTVPPKTKVNFALAPYHKTLILTNPFVRVSISIDYRGTGSGLGDYRWLLGYDDKRSAEFWSEHFRVICKAEFEKTRSGHPDMTKYKQWAKTMFAQIQYQLDDEKRLKRARDYRDLTNP